MVKCAAFNCRSGYAPNKAEKHILKAGGSASCSYSVFSFPKADRPDVREKWLAAIRRADGGWNPDHAGICELHFLPDAFKGETFRKTERQRKVLKPTAVPSVFPCYPDTAKPKQIAERCTKMSSPSARQDAANRFLQQQTEAMLAAEKLASFDDLITKLAKEILPAGFVVAKMKVPGSDQHVITVRMEEFDCVLGMPVISRNLTIYPDLHFRMHVSGVEVSVRKASKLTDKSGVFNTITEVSNVLARLKTIAADQDDLLAMAADLLDKTGCDERNEESSLLCQFASEQLRLVGIPPKRRRYSPLLLSTAMVWDRTSPKLYDDLYCSGLLVLPHRVTIRRLTSALSVKEGLEVGTVRYLQMRVRKLDPREKLVNLAMDEVYTARAVELAGGRVYGDSDGGVTNTIFCSHISSVAGSYEDIVSMSPVSHITASDIKSIFMQILKTLTEVGFTVVSVTTDNHRANQSFHNSLGESDGHPEFVANPYSSDAEARIYTMYDTVHLFKNMYFNLLNKKTLLCTPMEGSESYLRVEFDHLLQVYSMECGAEAKMAYRLTDRVLHPTSVERVNVQLAIAATHETTVAALDYHGQKEEHRAFKDTAQFLRLVRKWFDAVNLKNAYAHIRRNNPNCKPVSKDDQDTLRYVEQFGAMMRVWLRNPDKSHKLSKDTLQAVSITCRGIVGLSRYLLEKPADLMQYVLLGKVQSDRLEGRFGHLRKLAGGNYWASVRQFLEGEAVIRAKSLVKLSGYNIGEVAAEMEDARQQRSKEDDAVVIDLVEMASQTENAYLDEGAEQALTHLAGYLARSVFKVHKCDGCRDVLVNKETTETRDLMEQHDEVSGTRSFTELLNRGKLLCPSEIAVTLTKDLCFTYRCIAMMKPSRYALFGCGKPKEVFQKVAGILGEEDDRLMSLECTKGHQFIRKAYWTMSGALFNAFTSNYAKEVNSGVHANRKRSSASSNGLLLRQQDADKRKKLTGVKK